jgi:type I restriction enzyme S subunit
MVPNGWKNLTLGDLVVSSAFGPRFSSDLYSENGSIGTIRTTDLCKEGSINYQTIPYADLDVQNYTSHLLCDGDLLITRSGTCGVPCIFEKQDKPIIAGAFLIRFILKDDVHPTYLHFLLKDNVIQDKISKMASGGVQKNLTGTNLKKLKLVVPCYEEQRKIAKILGSWDKAISTTERLIDNSKQQKKSLMQQLLTGKKRLLDDSGKPFEGEWEILTLAEVAKIKKGKALSSKHLEPGDFPVIAGGKSSPYKHSKYTHEDIITISASGAYAGFVAYHKHKIWASDCSVVEAKENAITQFIFQFLLLNQIKIYSLQSGGAQPHIYPKDIDVLKISVPNLVEQQKIAAVLTNVDKEIELLEEQLADLKQEKKALMQQMLTGKRRVKI